ncbi:MAG TPA: class I SAM-dependent methyltransferase [Acidimicrobiales bacterium]|nr:class I SAM-dependent methyltransferase [Acidimicrobiales bacterium]
MAHGAALRSQLCTEGSLCSPELVRWAYLIRPAWDPGGVWDPQSTGSPVIRHRKLWEYAFIARALEERGMLAPGRRGLGFGVGAEPLVAAFAARGCQVVATDLDPDRARQAGWAPAGGAPEDLNRLGLCPPEEFAERVSFRPVDMNRIPADLGGFDFLWSSCALEHLGSILQGQAFVLSAMRCLRPGGVAVHTTEFNLSADDATVDYAPTVLLRRRDVQRLVQLLRQAGHQVEEPDLDPGSSPADRHVDTTPPGQVTWLHLKCLEGGFITTSLGLIVTRGLRTTTSQRLRLAAQAGARRRLGGSLARLPPRHRARATALLARIRGAGAGLS